VDRNDGSKNIEDYINKLNTMLDTFDEITYIDWNSPNGSFLSEIKDKLPQTNRIKHFSISPNIVSQILNNVLNLDVSLISKSLAFNLGLRRTNAEWVVFSSMDTIPPTKETIDSFLTKANKNTLYTFNLDFQLASKNLWLKIKGGEENMLWEGYINENIQKKALMYGFKALKIDDIKPNTKILQHTNKLNDIFEWFNNFDKLVPSNLEPYEFIISRNNPYWGLFSVEIEHEFI
jgi:hypothetical protein